jgi:acyl carrier protein
MVVQTKTERINLSHTHRIPAPQPCVGTGVIDFGVARQHLIGTARFISMRRSRCSGHQMTRRGHARAAWDKAPKQPRRHLGQSCQVALMCVPQAWNTKLANSRSVRDQAGLARGSSASFRDLALVIAGTRKALASRSTQKQARPTATLRSLHQRKPARSTRSSATLLNELKQIASEVINKDVSVDAPLMDAGLDSISATELSNKISAHLNTELSPTLLFDHPSLQSIADALSADSGSAPAQEFEPEHKAPVLPTVAYQVPKRAASRTSGITARSVSSIIKSIQTTL